MDEKVFFETNVVSLGQTNLKTQLRGGMNKMFHLDIACVYRY